MEKLLIIDSNSIMNRAYFALPPMVNGEGLHTNAIYGYINMLNKLREEIKPDYIVATFDKKGPTFRHDEYADYKAGRKKMDDELAEQLPVMKEVLNAFSVSILELDGYEADDLIGTIADRAEKEGMECYILSGDKDTLQLASDQTKVVITKKGITDKAVYDKAAFIEEFGITPVQFIDVKGLMGDKSDNIPGVPSIGEKTAFDLIKTYGSIEGVYENLDVITKKKVKENLITYKNDAFFSKKLATIMRDVPTTVDFDDIKDLGNYDLDKIRALYLKLQFKTLLAKLPPSDKPAVATGNGLNGMNGSDGAEGSDGSDGAEGSDGSAGSAPGGQAGPKGARATGYLEITTGEAMGKINQGIKQASELLVSFTYHPDPMLSKREIEYIYLSFGGQRALIDFQAAAKDPAFMDALRVVFEDDGVKKYGYDVKNAYTVMKKHGINFKAVDFDVLLAAYLLEPNKGQYSLSELIASYLEREINETGHQLRVVETGYLKELSQVLKAKIEEAGLQKLYYEVELPLTNVLSDMEMEGMRVDAAVLEKLGERFTSEIITTQAEIFRLADEEFNINSPKQLGTILFDKLDLPHGRKTKTGWSTNQEVLDSLMDLHPIIEKVQYFRQLSKMYSTYVEGLRNAIDTDSRIHSNFNQTLAVTGRLSSTEPNLQNIPIKYEMGRELRKAFVPLDEDSLLLSSDYSQIELRVLAHIAGDENMLQAFHDGVDIHTKTASEVFGKTPEEVTPKDRSNAKAVNFGIVYGISDYALGMDLHISRKEAREYIDRYYDRYPKIKAYLDNAITEAKATGMVKTIMGRRRQIPEVNASNKIVQAAGARLAMNSPIQGSAADIMKAAMVKVHDALLRENLKSRMILQVHDEIIINMKKSEQAAVLALVDREMENAVELDVQLKSDQSIGQTWYEA